MTLDLEQLQNQNSIQKRIERIEEEYKPNMEDTDEVREIKEKIFSLPEHKRRIMILWIDSQSYSSVARMLNCSAPTISKYIRKLRKELGI